MVIFILQNTLKCNAISVKIATNGNGPTKIIFFVMMKKISASKKRKYIFEISKKRGEYL